MVVEGRFHEDVFGLVSNTQTKVAAAQQLKPEQDTFNDLFRSMPGTTTTQRKSFVLGSHMFCPGSWPGACLDCLFP